MARQRRGPELRGTLGTLLRTARESAGTLRDVLERGAREGRSRVEDALAGRRRTDSLAELGEIVLDLIRRGEIDVDELPEIHDVVAHLDELDATTSSHHDEPAIAAPRKRFDARARAEDDGTVSSTWAPTRKSSTSARVWRPPADDAAEPVAASRVHTGGISFDHDDDDADLAEYMHPDDVPKKPDS